MRMYKYWHILIHWWRFLNFSNVIFFYVMLKKRQRRKKAWHSVVYHTVWMLWIDYCKTRFGSMCTFKVLISCWDCGTLSQHKQDNSVKEELLKDLPWVSKCKISSDSGLKSQEICQNGNYTLTVADRCISLN